MNCCEELDVRVKPVALRPGIDRRTALKGIGGAAAIAAASASGIAQAQALSKVKLAFCGQLLCVVPYEVTRERGHFRAEGIDMELVYTRGGSAAMQALVGGAVDYAGTAFDVAVQARSRGADVVRFASTGRLPLFALAVAPKNRDTITSLKALEGKSIGVSGLGNADHALAVFLMTKAGAKPDTVRFAVIGTNLFDALRLGQVDAGMVQEPALSLVVEAGGTALVNIMDIEHARTYLGGPYEFMGVAIRAEERDRRLDEMRRLAHALTKGLIDTRTLPVKEVAAALPKELVAGGDRERFEGILEKYRGSLYPESVRIDLDAAQRAVDTLDAAGLLKARVDLSKLLDREVVGG
ncbi:MAG: transporter substrate-binding domain-containing protein [Alphaproteobacteria bacterium]|nr:transporter substrate-binding domain-containing protein [Alphaproteobacteria bacterium]